MAGGGQTTCSAQSCRSPVVGHSALQPVRPDFRCDREIPAQVNSQFADKVAFRRKRELSLFTRTRRKAEREADIRFKSLRRAS